MNRLRQPKTIAIMVVALLWLLIPVFTSSPRFLHLFILLGISVMFSLSWRLIYTTGQLSFAHAGFIGIGAYTSAILMVKAGTNFWLAILASGIITAILGYIFGLPFLRLKGLYFAISTFAFQEVLRSLWTKFTNPFGGPMGMANLPQPTPIPIPLLGAITFNTKTSWFYLVTVFLLITVVFLYRVDKSRFGWNLRAVRAADDLAASLGIDPMYHKVLAFALACFIAGVAGSLYGHYLTFISPDVFTMWLTTDVLVFALIGGTANVLGPSIGAGLLIFLSDFLGVAGYYKTMVYGAILILFMLFLPDGLISIPEKIQKIVKREH